MRTTTLGSLLLAAAAAGLLGCEGSRSPAQASTAAPAQAAPSAPSASAEAASVALAPAEEAPPVEEAELEGWSCQVAGAPAGSLAFVVQPDPAARDLLALADTILAVGEADASGTFRFPGLSEPSAPGLELLVSAPGFALASAPLGEAPALVPAARIELELRDTAGAPVELAFALALDAEGRPLPLPTAEAVSDAAGRLALLRLPAGTCEVLVASPGAERMARLELSLAAGQTYRRALTLRADDELTRRFLVLCGGPEVAAAIGAAR